VGDIVTETLVKVGIVPYLAIIDGKTKRKSTTSFINYENIFQILRAKNEAGVIRYSVFLLIKNILREEGLGKNYLLLIDGEEDLLTIPVILYSNRDKDIVLYGQPNAGAVVIRPSDAIIWRVHEILGKMVIKPC